MTNVLMFIAILLLLEICGQLIKINERQDKKDAGKRDGE